MPTPFVEPLESRQLFAGIVFSGHILRVIGNVTANVETVGLTPDGKSVEATLSFSNKQGVHDFSKIVPLSSTIRLVSLVGGNGADTITVDQTNGSFPIVCHMFGGGGNDTIMGGDEPDSINGGTGADYLEGGNGNDTLFGAAGNDTLIGDAGNDSLNGGLGHDSMVGGDGNDTLSDALGPDTMLGGAGNNLFIGSIIGRNLTDYDSATDRVRIVSVNTSNSDNSTLDSIFPILNWF